MDDAGVGGFMNQEDAPKVDGLLDRRVSRRQVIKGGILLGLGATSLGTLAAACGGSSSGTAAAGSTPAGAVITYGGSGVADRAIAGARALNAAGSSLTLVYPSGAGPNFTPFLDEWTKQTGIKVETFEIPIDSMQDKVFAAATAKTSSWNVVLVHPLWYGDLAAAGAIVDCTAWENKYDPMIKDPKYGMVGPQAEYGCSFGGKFYGFDNDADIYIMAYRADLMNDPKEQSAFKAKFGYDLKPAETWDQFRDQAEFFTRKPNMWGAVEQVSKYYAYWCWEPRFASLAAPNKYYFDDDMHPLLESPEGIKATQLLVDLKPYMPPDIIGWNYTQIYPTFANGNGFMLCIWPSIAKFSENKETSKIAGNVGYAEMPGSDISGQVNKRTIYAFGNSLAMWKHGDNQEAAYLFSQWMTSPEVGARSTAEPGYSDPTRLSYYSDPKVQAVYNPKCLDVLKAASYHAAPDVFLRGALQYTLELDSNVLKAYTGDISPEEAMAKTAQKWEQITDNLGRETQKEAWQVLKTYYPT